jgi:DNA-binding transcriptional LysR family regulator
MPYGFGLDLNLLVVFDAIHGHGSVSLAARSLGIS